MEKIINLHEANNLESNRHYHQMEAIKARGGLLETKKDKNLAHHLKAMLKNMQAGGHESTSKRLGKILETEVETMFYNADYTEMANFYNMVSQNAFSLDNKELSEELSTMEERNADQTRNEYRPKVHSTLAETIQEIALFIGNRVKKPHLIKINPDEDSVHWNPINAIDYQDEYEQSKVDTNDARKKVEYLYDLLGLSDHTNEIPDFSKKTGFFTLTEPTRSFVFPDFKDPVVFTFRFLGPTTKSVGPDAEMRYYPARVTLQLNKYKDDMPQTEIAPEQVKKPVYLGSFQPKLVPEVL